MRTLFALLIARAVSMASRMLGRGSGSALPGLIVERIAPDFLQSSLKTLPQGVVLITGTNGKTTTTKMVVELLRLSGVNVLTNESGSNFTRGILSTLVRHSTLTGRLKYDVAVLELDEAYARIIAEQVPPKLVVALNVHRDQLDRYGEINTTAQMIGDAMMHARFAIVNADDPALLKVVKDMAGKGPTVGYFGAHSDLLSQMPTDDELHGERDSALQRPHALVELVEYRQNQLTLSIDGQSYAAEFQLPGIYNAVNAAAAVMAVIEIAPSEGRQSVVTKLGQLKPAFGRGERFSLGNKQITFGLVKNPSGFNHNLQTMLSTADAVLICVNDEYADGRDVSWFWDVHFAQYAEELKDKNVLVGGVRANDMILRLSQDGIEATLSEDTLAASLDQALEATETSLVIFPTYTAMLRLREALSSKTEVPDIW